MFVFHVFFGHLSLTGQFSLFPRKNNTVFAFATQQLVNLGLAEVPPQNQKNDQGGPYSNVRQTNKSFFVKNSVRLNYLGPRPSAASASKFLSLKQETGEYGDEPQKTLGESASFSYVCLKIQVSSQVFKDVYLCAPRHRSSVNKTAKPRKKTKPIRWARNCVMKATLGVAPNDKYREAQCAREHICKRTFQFLLQKNPPTTSFCVCLSKFTSRRAGTA